MRSWVADPAEVRRAGEEDADKAVEAILFEHGALASVRGSRSATLDHRRVLGGCRHERGSDEEPREIQGLRIHAGTIALSGLSLKETMVIAQVERCARAWAD